VSALPRAGRRAAALDDRFQGVGAGPARLLCSEARWLRYAHVHLGQLLPYLPKQPGYNKRLRRAANLLRQVIGVLASDTTWWTDDVWVADSTPVECGRSRETTKRSALAGWAQYGYCASHSRRFWGCGCTWYAPSRADRSASRWPALRPTSARCVGAG
jgi:hypothetical protein